MRKMQQNYGLCHLIESSLTLLYFVKVLYVSQKTDSYRLVANLPNVRR